MEKEFRLFEYNQAKQYARENKLLIAVYYPKTEEDLGHVICKDFTLEEIKELECDMLFDYKGKLIFG